MNKVCEMDVMRPYLRDGISIMIGGFLTCGTPLKLVDYVVASGITDIHLIVTDTGYANRGSGKLICSGQAGRLTASYIGSNPETGKRMHEGTLHVELSPQGTLAERIRCGGHGLGGFLTPTGLGTMVEEGKQVVEVDGTAYLLEKGLRADLALIYGSEVDPLGNIVYRGTTKNFNPLMAMAADTVIVQAGALVGTGDIEPEFVMTPGIVVDHIIL